MHIKKKITVFFLAFAIILSFGKTFSVQAATGDINTILDSSVTNPSNSGPNPGIPENKPSALNIISQYNTQTISNAGNDNINVTSTISWKKENGYWYYYKSDNTRATGWIKPDNNWYYLNYDGRMATGWLYSNGSWYYLEKTTGAMIKGWKKINDTWYFLNNSGAMLTGLNVIDNKTYLFYSSGTMATGWLQLNNYWYYFDNSGSMATGWVSNNGYWYYLYDTGAMAKGWINLNGNWYYLKNSGAMTTGWINSGSDHYYLDSSSGKLLTNTIIDGCKIGSDGKSIGNAKYKGIDISHYNGNIDFTKVKASGIQCVYMKATEGTSYVDNNLETYYKGAKSAGLKTGFYHFLVGTSNPESQADNFYNKIKDKQSDLKPVLDVEVDGFNVMDYTIRFINEFKKISNMDICIYTYSDFINNLDNRLANYSLWEANYYRSSSNLPSNNVWTFRAGHQYTDGGSINGINGNVDLDDFTQDIFLLNK